MKLKCLIESLVLISLNLAVAQARAASFAPDSLGHAPVCYLPVVLINTQSTNTSPNLPVRLSLISATYSTLEAANLSNINVQDGASNILASWLESGESNASTSTNYWIKLPNSIPSNSLTTVYLVFYSAGVNSKDASITGTEPLWAGGGYGQYDSGPAVFSFYDNFQGISLAPSWHGDANSTRTVNNGLTIQSNRNAWYGIYNDALLPVSGIVESSMSQSGTSGFGTIGTNNANTTWTGGGISFQERTAGTAGLQWRIAAPGTVAGTGAGNASLGTQYLVTGTAGSSPSSSTLQIGYGTATVTDTDSPSNALNVFLGAYGTAPTYGPTQFQWVRTRSYPPGGVLPSFTLGAVNCVAPTPIASTTPTPTPTPLFAPTPSAPGSTPMPTATASGSLPGGTPSQLTLPIEILGPAGFT